MHCCLIVCTLNNFPETKVNPQHSHFFLPPAQMAQIYILGGTPSFQPLPPHGKSATAPPGNAGNARDATARIATVAP